MKYERGRARTIRMESVHIAGNMDGAWHGADKRLRRILFMRSRCLASTFTFSASLHIFSFFSLVVKFCILNMCFFFRLLLLFAIRVTGHCTLSFYAIWLSSAVERRNQYRNAVDICDKMVKSIGISARSKWGGKKMMNTSVRYRVVGLEKQVQRTTQCFDHATG